MPSTTPHPGQRSSSSMSSTPCSRRTRSLAIGPRRAGNRYAFPVVTGATQKRGRRGAEGFEARTRGGTGFRIGQVVSLQGRGHELQKGVRRLRERRRGRRDQGIDLQPPGTGPARTSPLEPAGRLGLHELWLPGRLFHVHQFPRTHPRKGRALGKDQHATRDAPAHARDRTCALQIAHLQARRRTKGKGAFPRAYYKR
jgi:hypothetical protein